METLEALIKGDEKEEANVREDMRHLLTSGGRLAPAATRLKAALDHV